MRNSLLVTLCSLLLFQTLQATSTTNTLSDTQYVSIQNDGITLSTGADAQYPSVSGDGRYVVFHSNSANLVSGDTNGTTDIFLKDMQTGALSIISKSAGGVLGNGASLWPTISTNGRFIVFYSTASNLVSNDTNGLSDVFLVDRGTDDDETNNTITRVSLTTSGGQIGYYSAVRRGAVSNDGAYVVFSTPAIGSAMGGITDTNRNEDIYLWQRSTGTSKLISHAYSSTTTAGNGASTNGVISDDGKFISYLSMSTNLDSNIGGTGLTDNNGLYDVFLYNVETDTTKLISLTTTNQLVTSGTSSNISMSSTGLSIAWATTAKLDPLLDLNSTTDVYLYDQTTDSIVLVSTFNYGSGKQHDTLSVGSYFPAVSSDGRYVSFASYSLNLVPGKNSYQVGEAYVHDMTTGDNIRVSVAANGAEADSGSPYSMSTDISDDGRYVVYSSLSTGLVAGIDDTNSKYDIFRSYADWTAPSVTETTLEKSYLLTGPNSFTVTFSKPMTPSDSTSPYSIIADTGANSPANYILVEAGTNGKVDYAGCGDDKSAVDDTFIAIDQVVYDNSTYATQVDINGGTGLGVGKYRFIACGTNPYAPPALFDALGNKMAGDYLFDFSVTSPTEAANSSGSADASKILPNTGFPPGKTTPLSIQPLDKTYSTTGLSLEIPSLKISASIVGVPGENGEWDLSWLGKDVGWLSESAYPTWQGNTILTGHVWDSFNQPGIFVNLKDMRYGDKILIHSDNQAYIYEVRENQPIGANDFETVFKHEDQDWITLLTCEDYDSVQENYSQRRIVRAVLIEIQ